MRLQMGLVVLAWTGAALAGAQQAGAPAAKPVGWLLVLDKPYEGVREYDRVQKHADGSTLKLHETSKFYRDAGGRLRQEVTRGNQRVVWTYLTDPAAKVQYRWNNEQKVAFQSKIGDPIPARDPANPLAGGEVREVTVRVEGNRLKAQRSLLPAKTVDGQETVGTHEVAYSDPELTKVVLTSDTYLQPAYHVVLDQKIVDEHYGQRVFHYTSFKPNEPKAELFQVPKGYTIKQVETPDSEQFD